MADRLADLVLGLRRLTEAACVRGDDLEFLHQQEDREYLEYIDALLAEVQKLHSALISQRRRFVPVERHTPEPEKIPRVVKQGPAA